MSPETRLISSEVCGKDGDQHWKGQIWLRFWSLEGSGGGIGEFDASILVPQSHLAHLER